MNTPDIALELARLFPNKRFRIEIIRGESDFFYTITIGRTPFRGYNLPDILDLIKLTYKLE